MDKEKLLEKWLKDELSPAEQKAFEQQEDFPLHEEIIRGARQFKASHFSKPPSYEEFKSNLKKAKRPVRVVRLNTFMRVAAAIIISFGLYFAFFSNQSTTVETLASQQNTVELPDASEVTLNAESSITYNKKNWNKKRQVTLDGEAFFKVAKGATFDVLTDVGTVTVLGTEFTVNERDSYFEVKCFEGVVKVVTLDEAHTLTQGKSFRLLNDQSILSEFTMRNPEWLNNITNFNSVPFIIVLEEFERQYNIEVTTENIDIDRIFTGGFIHNNLDDALKSITTPLEIDYKKESKNKIVLYSSKK